jgi:protein SCO1/2
VILIAFMVAILRGHPLPVYGTLPDFTLTNQDGKTVTLADFHGKVWIADAIFTRCPGQCLQMTAHMTQLEHSFPPGQVLLVSFTTDPDFDKPAILKKYGNRFDAIYDRWSFLTGDKKALHGVEVDGLRLPVLDKPVADQQGSNDLFIHSEKFVLLDKQGRIRGYYDGQDPAGVRQVLAAAQTLVQE